jgi:transcription factor E
MMVAENSLLTDILSETLTEGHVTVIGTLSKPKHDEDIAAELNLKATVVRTLLNDLHIKNLVEYERSKNKKTGWYTYLWKRREDRIDEFVQSHISGKLNDLQKQLDLEKEGVTFNCACNRVTLGDAMETNFMCPSCSEAFVESDNDKIIKKLEIEIKKLNKIRR